MSHQMTLLPGDVIRRCLAGLRAWMRATAWRSRRGIGSLMNPSSEHERGMT